MKIHGGAPEGTIDFSAPTNPLGPPPLAEIFMHQCLKECRKYPDPEYRSLVEALMDFYGFDKDTAIIPVNGAAEAYSIIPLVYRPKYIVTLDPTFGDIDDIVESCGSKRISICMECADGWWRAPEGIEYVLERIDGPCLAIVSLPNNPTGSYKVLKFVEVMSRRCLVLLDTAFLDISNFSVDVRIDDNIVLVHSLTKTLALPGIRFGFIAIERSSELYKRLELARQPWNVNSVAKCVIERMLKKYDSYVKNFVALSRRVIAELRSVLVEKLSSLGFEVFESVAPYVLAKFDSMDRVLECLRMMGIYVRPCTSFRCLDSRFARFSVRLLREIEVLYSCLKRCLECLSLDLF